MSVWDPLNVGRRQRPNAGTSHMGWKIELDYKQLKSELGVDHYEGPGWGGSTTLRW